MKPHPRDMEVSSTYDVADEADAQTAVDEMVRGGFEGARYRVLMPKDERTAKRIGYVITTGVTSGLRKRNMERNVRYWTYHHDADHYGMVLAGAQGSDPEPKMR